MNALIKCAGYEDPKIARAANRSAGIQRRIETACDLFDSGLDTLDISLLFHCSEARVLQWLNEARSARRNLPSPYEARA